MAHKGKFKPKNPHKYRGDHSKIVYRSSWELKFMRECDLHPQILEWSSEEVVVQYINMIDGRKRRYFPDFLIRKINKEGIEEKILVEIKPWKQTQPPDTSTKFKTKTGRVSTRFLNEVKTYGMNISKWKAAEAFCNKKGWRFLVLTEKGEARNWREQLENLNG